MQGYSHLNTLMRVALLSQVITGFEVLKARQNKKIHLSKLRRIVFDILQGYSLDGQTIHEHSLQKIDIQLLFEVTRGFCFERSAHTRRLA